MIRSTLGLLALLAAPASTFAQRAGSIGEAVSARKVGVGSFDRVRITGPIEVTFTQGGPRALVSGDPRLVERVELRVDGATLTVRMGGGVWGGRPDAAASPPAGPVAVTLSAPSLSAASVFAGGRLNAARMRGQRIDLSVSGSGEIRVADAAADQFRAGIVGTGVIAVAGRAAKATLTTNGAGRIDAEKLLANEMTVVLEGPGETKAAARYTARVRNTGLGSVSVAGGATCVVSAPGGGTVRCGR